jgi:hypothetical protein
MQKWEYATLYVLDRVVLRINTPQYGDTQVGSGAIVKGRRDGVPLFDTLNRMGPDGWEVCGVVVDADEPVDVRRSTVVLKRPLA